MALATIIEAWPGLDTPGDIRLACENVATDLQEKVKVMREQFEQTGKPPWDATIVQVN